ncbi:hypothetical protein ACFRCW_38915 [Streptomyces sp. NPDC056653]|uniref:hypothetical protein n=1 Tax=Streptomyces sp. NPDC056653 TaxID=3345894 RepID=UPI00367FFF36
MGVAVNALILPPTHIEESGVALRGLARSLGALLRDMGRALGEGRNSSGAPVLLERGCHLEEQVAEARDDLQQAAESLRWNARAALRGQRISPVHESALQVLNRASYQVRGIARTLADNVDREESDRQLGQIFTARYAEALELAGQLFETYASSETAAGSTQAAREELRAAIERMLIWHGRMTDLIERGALVKSGAWHVYGSLVIDVERLLFDLDCAVST